MSAFIIAIKFCGEILNSYCVIFFFKNCDTKNNEEKQTDVNIACEIMQDVYEDNFDIAYLVSGDSDLVAPVKKVLALDKIMIIAFPPDRKAKHLIDVATNWFDIKKSRIIVSQFLHFFDFVKYP
jgi:uncharacterized LabA/DUF88 family protein